MTSRSYTLRRLVSRLSVGLIQAALAVALCVFVLSVSAPATFAQEKGKMVSFDIPAGDAVKALKQFSAQSGQQLLYSNEDLAGVNTNAVKGRLGVQEALDRLLAKTPLAASRDDSNGAVAVGRKVDPNAQRLAQKSSDQPIDEKSDIKDGVLKLDTFEVMGSKLLNMDKPRSEDDPQPYVLFDRANIERSGATNLEDFLVNRLPMNTVAGPNGQRNEGNFDGNLSRINLRGLGANQTLILVDGHRVAGVSDLGTGLFQPDINGIPLSAVERVEVLPTTASGIYGGSATGGVINIILRRDYAGAEVKLTYENVFKSDAGRRRADIAVGFNLEGGKTNVLLGASYSDANQLLMGDRNLVQRGRALLLVNNNYNFRALDIFGLIPPFGATTNIRSADNSNLVLKNGTSLNSAITYVPVGYSGTASDGGLALVANAGKYSLNLGNTAEVFGGGKSSIGQAPKTESLTAMLRRQFTPRFQMFVEGTASNTASRRSVGTALVNALFFQTIPATASNNPFQQNIKVAPPIDYSAKFGDQIYSNSERRIVAGLLLKLPRDWQAESDYTWNQTRRSFDGINVALTATGVAAIRDGTVDVLRDLNKYPADSSTYLYQTQSITAARNTLQDASLRFAGPLGSLPGGDPQLAFSLERRHEKLGDGSFSSAGFSQYNPSRQQLNYSGYAELRAPLVKPKMEVPGVSELEIQLAGRWDDYSIDGVPSNLTSLSVPFTVTKNKFTSTNPTVALRLVPVPDVTLRVSYGTGFLPPGVDQLAVAGTFPSSVIDPKRGNETAPITFAYGGTPTLKPELSTSWSAGAILTPHFVTGLRVSVDWTRIDKTDNISTHPGSAQGLVNDESLYPDHVVRAPVVPGDPFGVGKITDVFDTFLNLARAQVEAYDVQIGYTHKTDKIGTIEFLTMATWQTHYKIQSAPDQLAVEYIGVSSNNPLKFRGNADLNWRGRQWSVGWSVHYYDSYYVNIAKSVDTKQGSATVPSQTYHDAFISYRPSHSGTGTPTHWFGLLDRTEITFGLKNVFNARPPFDASNNILLTSLFGDSRGASYYLSVKKNF